MHRAMLFIFILSAGLVLGSSAPCIAQVKKPLPVKDWLETRTILNHCPVTASEDGRYLAFTVVQSSRRGATPDDRTTGVPFYGPGGDVWSLDVVTGRQQDLTGGRGDSWMGTCSPDGRMVAFLSDRDSPAGKLDAGVWIWDRKTHRVRRLENVTPHAYTTLVWTRDSAALLLRTTTRKQPIRTGAPATGGPTADVFRYDPSVQSAASTDYINLDSYLSDLVEVDVATGRIKPLLSRRRISGFWLSPQGDRVAVQEYTGFFHAASSQGVAKLEVCDRSSGTERVLAERVPAVVTEVAWSPRGDRLAFKESGWWEAPDVGRGDVYVAALGSVVKVTAGDHPSFLADEGTPLWDADGRTLYFTGAGQIWKAAADGSHLQSLGKALQGLRAYRGNQIWSPDGGRSTVLSSFRNDTKSSTLIRMDLATGAVTPLLEEGRLYREPEAVLPDGVHLAYTAESAATCRELWLLDGKTGATRRLTHTNPSLDAIAMGQGRLVEWKTADGRVLHGALILPAGYQEGHRYPTIVEVYGGENGSNKLHTFGGGMGLTQLFATRGYAYLLPDAPWRGGAPMADTAATILPGVDRVVEMGIADPDRLGVYGNSNGGYTCLALIVQDTRFKAAIANASMGDLVSYFGGLNPDGTAYGIQDLETGLKGMQGPPWAQRERYVQNSPVFFLDKVRTPLLIIHGETDIAGHPSQAEEIFVGLRRLGQPVTYVKYRGEGHEFTHYSAANQLDYVNRAIEWYDRYLKPGDAAGPR